MSPSRAEQPPAGRYAALQILAIVRAKAAVCALQPIPAGGARPPARPRAGGFSVAVTLSPQAAVL